MFPVLSWVAAAGGLWVTWRIDIVGGRDRVHRSLKYQLFARSDSFLLECVVCLWGCAAPIPDTNLIAILIPHEGNSGHNGRCGWWCYLGLTMNHKWIALLSTRKHIGISANLSPRVSKWQMLSNQCFCSTERTFTVHHWMHQWLVQELRSLPRLANWGQPAAQLPQGSHQGLFLNNVSGQLRGWGIGIPILFSFFFSLLAQLIIIPYGLFKFLFYEILSTWLLCLFELLENGIAWKRQFVSDCLFPTVRPWPPCEGLVLVFVDQHPHRIITTNTSSSTPLHDYHGWW